MTRVVKVAELVLLSRVELEVVSESSSASASISTSLRWTRAGIGIDRATAKEKTSSFSSWGRPWRRLVGWAGDMVSCWAVLVVVVVFSAMVTGLGGSL